MPLSPYFPIFELTRGPTVESIHYGAIAVTNAQGELVAHHGDPMAVTFLRSTAKPFQAMAFVEQGGPQAMHFTTPEIALICASHSGTDAHVAGVRSIQARAGVTEGDLQCGVHAPTHKPTLEAMQARGEAPTPNRHNCSGKHSGMLAYARLNGWPIETYLDPANPVQQNILRAFAEMCALPPEQVALGTDGCSAPNFAVPLCHAARAYARLCDPQGLPAPRAAACRTITHAMASFPEMIAGPGDFDTALMEAGRGLIVSKGGAEGYQGLGLLPGACGPGSPALGITFKISDGDTRGRARSAVALEILRQLHALDKAQLAALAPFGPSFPVSNWRKLTVGEGRPGFVLA